jgi:hypothetical protein
VIPAEDIADPVKSLLTGLPLDLRFRTKGLASELVVGSSLHGVIVTEARGIPARLVRSAVESAAGDRPVQPAGLFLPGR